MSAPELRTPAEWAVLDGVTVMDPDGWRGSRDLPAKSFDKPISHDEWLERMTVSSVIRQIATWPTPEGKPSSVADSNDLPRDWRAVHILPGTPYPDEPSEMQPPGWFVMGGFSDDPEEGAAFILEVDQALDRDDTGMSLERLAQTAAARLNGGQAWMQPQYDQAVEDWGRNDEQMLAENQRLANEVAHLTEIIRKSDAVDKHNLQAELKQRNLCYGIASDTIGRLRGDLARVREERDRHIEHGSSFAIEAERLRGELRRASDRHERETAQIRGELRIEEDNVAFAEKTLHLVLQCCDGEQDSCAALEAVYGYVRLGEKPPVADAVVLPSYEDVVDAVRVAVGRKGDERDEEAVAAVLDYLRSCGVSSKNGDRADV